MIAGFVLKSPTDRGLRTHLKKNLTNAQTATLLEFVAQTFLFKNIAKGTTDPRVEFCLPKKLTLVISQGQRSAEY